MTRAVVELQDVKKADLSDLANAVANCDTPHKSKVAPAASLVLFGKVNKGTAEAASKALAGAKGVDAKAVKADEKAGEIIIPLKKAEKKEDKASLAGILHALKDAGIEVSTAKKG